MSPRRDYSARDGAKRPAGHGHREGPPGGAGRLGPVSPRPAARPCRTGGRPLHGRRRPDRRRRRPRRRPAPVPCVGAGRGRARAGLGPVQPGAERARLPGTDLHDRRRATPARPVAVACLPAVQAGRDRRPPAGRRRVGAADVRRPARRAGGGRRAVAVPVHPIGRAVQLDAARRRVVSLLPVPARRRAAGRRQAVGLCAERLCPGADAGGAAVRRAGTRCRPWRPVGDRRGTGRPRGLVAASLAGDHADRDLRRPVRAPARASLERARHRRPRRRPAARLLRPAVAHRSGVEARGPLRGHPPAAGAGAARRAGAAGADRRARGAPSARAR